MLQINDILQTKFPDADFTKDVILRDEGNGIYIEYWDEVAMGYPLPDQATLAQWNAEVAPIKALQDVRENRRQQYPAIGDQLDAVLKWIEHARDTLGEDLLPNPDLDNIINEWRDVKNNNPLPE